MRRLERPIATDPKTAAASRFRSFAPEAEKEVREAEVQRSPIIDKMRKRWEGMGFSESIDERDKSYRECLDAISGLEYSAKDVESFSLVLFEYKHDGAWTMKPGMFLSALINEGREYDYTVHTTGIENFLLLGYRNRKHVVIDGDGGSDLAESMEKGRIEVKGSAGHDCGRNMEGGSIIIEGDMGDFCGAQMIDGLIRVRGDAGKNCGHLKRKGTIIVQGDADEYCGNKMEGGSIYVRGDSGHSCGIELRKGNIFVGGDASRWCGNRMSGGRVFVRGNANTYCGQEMEGGTLSVSGDVGADCGWLMRGGQIHVDGIIAGLSKSIKGGRIFHKGELIWPK
jgi:formylmethanofuran dehydrogenase subunit C